MAKEALKQVRFEEGEAHRPNRPNRPIRPTGNDSNDSNDSNDESPLHEPFNNPAIVLVCSTNKPTG